MLDTAPPQETHRYGDLLDPSSRRFGDERAVWEPACDALPPGVVLAGARLGRDA